MIIQPLGCRVLIKRKLIGKVGSLYVPKGSREMKANVGEIAAAGSDCTKLKVGDLVTFGQYAPMIFDVSELQNYGIPYAKTDDEEYLLLNEEDALCILLKDGEAVIQ
jgi:co-chaperonin GroES (HSP10)